ncbi:MAG TPA: MOSC domain-containing protein [Caldilineaceae bacterium]|nr:MOSC domain-containing protein [Caldilineaceae bacterium]
MVSNFTLAGLYIYPIKACRGYAVDRAMVTARGLQDDRLLMIVDGDGHFLTQREYPQLALLAPTLGDGLLTMRAPGMSALDLPLRTSGPACPVVVWRDCCQAVDQGDAAATWLSDYLGTQARLVHQHDSFARPVDPRYRRRPEDETSFADGYPFLLISEASLADLNQRLTAPLPMDRFRPNLVVQGCEPFAEDGWQQIQVGAVTFDLVKPCARCQVTTVDQQRGTVGKEPLATLATFRRTAEGKVNFGQNMVSSDRGIIAVGEEVTVV